VMSLLKSAIGRSTLQMKSCTILAENLRIRIIAYWDCLLDIHVAANPPDIQSGVRHCRFGAY